MMWKREVGPVTIPVIIHKSSVIVGTLSGKIVMLNIDDGHEHHSFAVGAPVFANLLMTGYNKVTNCLLTCTVNGSLQWRNADEAYTMVSYYG